MANKNNSLGYIHKLAVTLETFSSWFINVQLVVRLDTAEKVPGFAANADGTALATMQFVREHLINILYTTYFHADIGVKEIENISGICLDGDALYFRGTGFVKGMLDPIYIDSLEDITE